MQTEDFRCVCVWQFVYVVEVTLKVSRLRHFVAFVEFETRSEQYVAEPNLMEKKMRIFLEAKKEHLSESSQKPFVEIVGDPSSVLHLAEHIADRGPRDTFLRIHIVEMILYELNAGSEVSLIELVGNIPTQRTELPPLLHHCVQEGDGVQQRRPLRLTRVVQEVLADALVRPLQAGSDPLRRLVGELDGHLQETDGELLVHLRRQPQPEGVLDGIRVQHHRHSFRRERKGQMDVLEEDPTAVAHRRLDHVASHHFLALAHRDGFEG